MCPAHLTKQQPTCPQPTPRFCRSAVRLCAGNHQAVGLSWLLLCRRFSWPGGRYKETLAVARKTLTRLALMLGCTTRGSSDGGCARQPAAGEAAEVATVVVAVPGCPAATNIQQSLC